MQKFWRLKFETESDNNFLIVAEIEFWIRYVTIQLEGNFKGSVREKGKGV